MAAISLAEHIRRFAGFGVEEQTLGSFVEQKTLSRREHLFQAGGDSRWLVFVETGLLRLYSIDQAAKERTHQFALEGWWLTDWEGFDRALPTKFHLQAVEESRVVLLHRDRYEPLLEAVPLLERYFRRIYQRAHAAAQRRLHLNETSGAEEMYRQFVKHYPEFVRRVPQYMLASFLGFTPEFLSRLRAQR